MTYHVVARPERSRGGAFDLHMQANRSTMPLPVIHVMIAAGITLLLLSARFVVIGAWPVAIFSLFDIALLTGARVIFRRRPPPAEQVSLRGNELVWHGSDGRTVTMPAFWARIETVERSPIDLTLWLRFRGERHQVGKCLALYERREVAEVLDRALRDARGWA
ncbi:MAG: hypothetical protein C0474_00745 [Sphingobium sp.]|nr:hypothetical protein [Sphingobium sp.]